MPNTKNRKVRILTVAGTRPEVIKLAPVLAALNRHSDVVSSTFCVTGQHRDLLDRALRMFDLQPDHDLNVMTHDQGLAALTGRLFHRLDEIVQLFQPEWLIVQGDTTSAMVAAMVAFYRRVRVAHVEAGLRTRDLSHPFPEEANRRIIDVICDLCFAPTEVARLNLRGEGIPEDRIHVTGNTIVDAVRHIADKPYDFQASPLALFPANKRWALVTTHRRENFGEPMRDICVAVRELAHRFPDVHFIVPAHPNPNARATVNAVLGGVTGCSVISPLDYADLIQVLKRACLILTDSGGIQEEAPTFGTQILILRRVTERTEGVSAGFAKVVGHDTTKIVQEGELILSGRAAAAHMENPYGDGNAAGRIVSLLLAAAGIHTSVTTKCVVHPAARGSTPAVGT